MTDAVRKGTCACGHLIIGPGDDPERLKRMMQRHWDREHAPKP